MRHLHTRFITAGLSLGLGILMIAVTIWQTLRWPANDQLALVSWLTQLSLLAGGITLIFYSWFEIEHEARTSRRR